MKNEQRSINNERWIITTINDKWRINVEEWTRINDQWTIIDEQYTSINDKWTMKNER